MTINIIAAVTTNGAIGRAGDLLFHLPADMRHFRSLTMGHPVVMGRRTFDTLPNGPLPGRRNIIVSRNAAHAEPGAETYPNLTSAITAACATDNDIYIIGGGQIYTQAMPLATHLCLTEIEAVVDDADTFFPAVDPAEWQAESVEEWQTDAATGIRYRFICLSRR